MVIFYFYNLIIFFAFGIVEFINIANLLFLALFNFFKF